MEKRISVWRNALKSWSSVVHAMYRMPILFGSALVVTFLLETAQERLLPPADLLFVPGRTALTISANITHALITGLVGGLINAPVAVAVYRFILLGEHDDRAIWKWRPEVRPFYMLFVLTFFLGALPRVYAPASPHLQNVLWASLQAIACFVYCRVFLIFPATAIGSSHANIEDCWQSSQGHFWYFFWTIAFTLLPWLVCSLLTYEAFVTRHISPPGAIYTVMVLVFAAVVPAVGSQLYRQFGSRSVLFAET